MDITNSKTAFRNPNYAGDGEIDAIEVMLFEVLELGNTDIFDTLLDSKLITDEIMREQMRDAAEYIEENGGPGAYDDSEYTTEDIAVRNLIKSIPDEIKRTTGKTIRFALWLASKDDVIHRYDGSEGEILEYPTSDVVLSNLGNDGALFGYEIKPTPIENASR